MALPTRGSSGVCQFSMLVFRYILSKKTDKCCLQKASLIGSGVAPSPCYQQGLAGLAYGSYVAGGDGRRFVVPALANKGRQFCNFFVA